MAPGSWKWLLFAAMALTLTASDGAQQDAGAGKPAHYRVGQPYKIDGVWYYPKADWSYDKTGLASWYGKPFHGRRTANGEIFNLHALSAAHRTLPMPVVVKVTNLDNGRSLKLRVNDRGPFVATDDRIIDVSKRAAKLLGFEHSGLAPVRVQIDLPASIKAAGGAAGGSLFNIPLPSLTMPALSRPILIGLVSALFAALGIWLLAVDAGPSGSALAERRVALARSSLPERRERTKLPG